jgi:hypothetical protein
LEIYENTKNQRLEVIYKTNFWIIFLIYSSYQAFVFLSSNSMVPDELMFIWMAKNHGFSIFNSTAPPIFYGSIYWALLQILETPLLVRSLWLIFFLTIPSCIFFYVSTWRYRFASLLLYLSFPFAFWNGKLIGPEIMSISIVSISLIFLVKRSWFAMFLGGVATGVKLSAAPCLIFMGWYAVIMKPKLPQLLGLLIACLIGLWFANPYNLRAYILSAPHSSLSLEVFYTLFSDKTYNILFIPSLTWDSLVASSFSDMVMRPMPYALYAILLFICAPVLFSLVASASILLLLVVINSNTAYVWYFFGLLPVYLFAVKEIESNHNFEWAKKYTFINRITQYRFHFLLALAILNLYQNVPTTLFQVTQKYYSIQMIKNLPKSCIRDSILEYSPDNIINSIEYGYELNDLDLDKKIVIQSGYESALVSGKKTLILVGHRFLESPDYLNKIIGSSSINLKAICNKVVFVYEVIQ